ncbi:hypothetical protein [Leptospira alexanderi]|uniref:hypothetical protein n=1 Tax=Leptospira alexanderi TaxID=100053 RepID=UPI001115788B|nr:hypothetical protein [Leptospira alexanderi]
MIGLEMLGYFSDKEDSQSYSVKVMKWVYPSQGNFISANQKKNHSERLKASYAKHSRINCQTFSSDIALTKIDFSDHLNYWNFGYNAIMLLRFLETKAITKPATRWKRGLSKNGGDYQSIVFF